MYRVLIVEDEDIIRKWVLMSVPWQEMDCTVTGEAGNGKEGVQKIRELRPDIVIADIEMPIMDGLEMLHQTHGDCEYAAIILSGYSSFKYAQKAIRYGVLDYLLKPLDKEELRLSIEKTKAEIEVRRSYIEKEKSAEEWRKTTLTECQPSMRESDPIVRQMLLYIEQNYTKKILTREVADALNYSETYLNRKFKEIMHTTFIEYLNRYRIQAAIGMLNEGKERIQDISWKCGIGEYKYFNIVFRKYLGCTPKEYIRLVGGKR